MAAVEAAAEDLSEDGAVLGGVATTDRTQGEGVTMTGRGRGVTMTDNGKGVNGHITKAVGAGVEVEVEVEMGRRLKNPTL